MMQFWHEWADSLEARLLQLANQTDFTEICERDDMDLIRKFLKYPDRPSIQPGSSQETQESLIDRAWHQWATDVEVICFALKDCLARGKANPKAHLMTFYTLDDKVSACPIPSLSQGDELSKVLCALLWVSGVKFSASSDGTHDLMGRLGGNVPGEQNQWQVRPSFRGDGDQEEEVDPLEGTQVQRDWLLRLNRFDAQLARPWPLTGLRSRHSPLRFFVDE